MAIFDKDITYEHIMNSKEEEEHYNVNPYTGSSEDNSFIPTKCLKVHPLIKKNFHLLYYITQKGLPFGWHTFLWQVINSLFMSLVLCLIGYQVYSGTTILHMNGYPADFWMASFGIYTALVFATIVAVIVRTSQITWIFILVFILGLSLGPFYILTYLYDTHLQTKSSLKEFVIFNLSDTYSFYLFFIFFMLVVFIIEIGTVYFRLLYKPTLADYFKWLLKNGKANEKEYFTPSIMENFISLHDPIAKKVDIDWTDIFSSKASHPIIKPEDQNEDHKQSETPETGQTDEKLKNQDRNELSALSGAENSTNQGTTHGDTTIQRQSIRSLESRYASIRDPIKSPTNAKDLFVIEDHAVDGQDDDESVYSIYSVRDENRVNDDKCGENEENDDKHDEKDENEDNRHEKPHLSDNFCEDFSEIRDEESSIIDYKIE